MFIGEMIVYLRLSHTGLEIGPDGKISIPPLAVRGYWSLLAVTVKSVAKASFRVSLTCL